MLHLSRWYMVNALMRSRLACCLLAALLCSVGRHRHRLTFDVRGLWTRLGDKAACSVSWLLAACGLLHAVSPLQVLTRDYPPASPVRSRPSTLPSLPFFRVHPTCRLSASGIFQNLDPSPSRACWRSVPTVGSNSLRGTAHLVCQT